MICFLLASLLLGALELPVQANDIVVNDEDINILISLNNKFKCQFKKETENKPDKQQFAVFYYGDPSKIDEIDIHNSCKLEGKNTLFLTRPDYRLDPDKRAEMGCSFTAAMLQSSTAKHTEKSCLYSFGEMFKGHIQYKRCPTGPNNGEGNVYMISYRNPCAGKETDPDPDEKFCVSVISHFAKDCGHNFNHMIIGYETDFSNTEEDSIKAIEKTDNVVMRRVKFPEVICTHMQSTETSI